jgi:excinuclease ABC subunit C
MTAGHAASGFDGKAYARALTSAPGVYRMYGDDDAVLYVGKAAALNKRVASYFTATPRSLRLTRMIAQIARMEVTVTRTEAEALLLENQLIKSLKPRYNVLLRDDKSYPCIYLSNTDTAPRIAFHRGTRSLPGRYFGPYPSVVAVRETLNLIHKLFKLRSCEDSVFRNRSRPCLQYQIQRCSAPCVNRIADSDYRASVRRAELFLDGKSDELTGELGAAMESASAALEFEQAARLRDLIANLRTVQARQYVDGAHADLDVLACVLDQGAACVSVLCFRDGMNLGTRAYFPRTNGSEDPAEVLAAFVTQHYVGSTGDGARPPREIVLSHAIADSELIEGVLGVQAGARSSCATACEPSARATLTCAPQRNARARRRNSAALQTSVHACPHCRSFLVWKNCRNGSSASTSATPRAKPPWLRASYSMPKARCDSSTGATTSSMSRRATTSPRCVRRWRGVSGAVLQWRLRAARRPPGWECCPTCS